MELIANRSIELIQQFPHAKVLVIGDVMLDCYLRCRAIDIADEAPVPLLEIVEQSNTLGGAANVARNLACLGVPTQLVGVVGNDIYSTEVTSLLEESGVKFCSLPTSRPTTRKTRVLAGEHYYLRLDEEQSLGLNLTENNSLEVLIKNQMQKANLVVISDYDKGLVSSALAQFIESLAHQLNLRVLADLKPQNALHWKALDLITPNITEARLLHSLIQPCNDLHREDATIARSLSESLRCDVVLKMDRQGMLIATNSGQISQLEAICHSPQDTTGAGDTVLSTLAATLAQGAGLEEAAWLANIAASISVSQKGTYAVSAKELVEAITRSTEFPQPIKLT